MSSTAIKLGKDGEISYNTGSYGSPVWVPVTNVNDLELAMDKDTDDVTIRASGGFELSVATVKKCGVTFGMNHDPADTAWAAIHAMFLNDTVKEFLVLNGPNTTTGNQGLRASLICDKFGKKQPLKGAQKDDVQLKPTVSANAPAWYTSS